MIDNLYYLKQSINNKENLIDETYIFKNYDVNIKKYVNETKRLKEILITIKTLESKNLKIDNNLYKEIIVLLNNYAKKSELSCFINACDINLDKIDNLNLIKQIIDLYLKNREVVNFEENIYKIWIQAIIDKESSKKKGKLGENKLINISKKYNYLYCDNINDFIQNNKVVANLSNKDFSINNICKYFNIDLNFNNQNKILDIILKNNKNIFIIEAKHIKTYGGEQDKQIVELINIIKKDNKNNNIHYVAFLDGIYSNKLLTNDLLKNQFQNNKLGNQQKDIIKILTKNKNNLWLNSFGFEKLLIDLN